MKKRMACILLAMLALALLALLCYILRDMAEGEEE